MPSPPTIHMTLCVACPRPGRSCTFVQPPIDEYIFWQPVTGPLYWIQPQRLFLIEETP